MALTLACGVTIRAPLDRLRSYCAEEYEFYDAVPTADPNHVDPADVAITIAVNSFVNTAPRLRTVQRGLAAACDPVLVRIIEDAALEDQDAPLDQLRVLLGAAVAVKGVLVPVATKVLHRKRPRLIPMLDQVVLNHYLDAIGKTDLKASTQDSRRAADTAMLVVNALRRDLISAGEDLLRLGSGLKNEGWDLTTVRILDILLWTEVEPRGYYRTRS